MEENKQIQTVAASGTEVLDINGASNKLAAMMVFVKENLKKGTDYMGIGGGKPTLLKSGAEKMNILVGYSVEYEKAKEIMTAEPQFYYVEIKAILRNRQGLKVAEGLASCNSDESNQIKTREKTGVNMYSQLNTILKMAEKRAYVGATLNANALSQFYTQDLEDMEIPAKAETTLPTRQCEGCHAPITEKVASFAVNNYGKMLCYDCQKKNKKLV